MSAQRPTNSPVYRLVRGGSPLVVSMPHVGTELPSTLAELMTDEARALPDTDWHVDQLYDFALRLGASVLVARYSRYVIDLNRPPDDASLYAGQTHTGLCPLRTFAGTPIYRDEDYSLSAKELEYRRQQYWQPYHDTLASAIAETRHRHGCVLLLDAHSIRSRVPRLFEGRLPDINLGTNDGRSCAAQLIEPLLDSLASQSRFSHVLNGRFKGGYITRHFGAPTQGVHALQIELAQEAYMDEQNASYASERAAPLGALLQTLVDAMLHQVPRLTGSQAL